VAALSDPLIQELLLGRRIACLGTENSDGSIHLTSVWYLFAEGSLYVATSSRTRKARNLAARPKASLMIDAREPSGSCGVTVSGAVQILTGESSRIWNARIHGRYLSEGALADARVGPVFASWDDVTVQIHPGHLFAWDMREADRAVFGGALAARPEYLLPLER